MYSFIYFGDFYVFIILYRGLNSGPNTWKAGSNTTKVNPWLYFGCIFVLFLVTDQIQEIALVRQALTPLSYIPSPILDFYLLFGIGDQTPTLMLARQALAPPSDIPSPIWGF